MLYKINDNVIYTYNISNQANPADFEVRMRQYQSRTEKNEFSYDVIVKNLTDQNKSGVITIDIPNNVKSHKDYKQKAFSYDIHVPANSDLIIIGTGFMNIKNETDVSLFNIDKKYIEVRPSIFR